MNICKSCNEETKTDEWSDYDKKICINCESDNDGYFNTKNIDEPKETNQQQENQWNYKMAKRKDTSFERTKVKKRPGVHSKSPNKKTKLNHNKKYNRQGRAQSVVCK